jgi:hypothetical protein
MMGVPRGDHSHLSKYAIEGVTINVYPGGPNTRDPPPANLAEALENILRSINNLSEHFHQSFYYYLLGSTQRYIPIGNYMIGIGVILGGFFAYHTVNALYASFRSLSFALPFVVIAHVGGGLVFAFPFVAQRLSSVGVIPVFPLPQVFQVWFLFALAVALVVIALFAVIARSRPSAKNPSNSSSSSSSSSDSKNDPNKGELSAAEVRAEDLSVFASLATFPYCLFLASFSLVNFSFAFFASIVTVPLLTVLGRSKLAPILTLLLNPILVLFGLSQKIVVDMIGEQIGYSIPTISTVYIFEIFAEYSALFYPFITLILFPLSLLQFQRAIMTFF